MENINDTGLLCGWTCPYELLEHSHQLTVLADVIEIEIAVRVGPQPFFSAIEPGTIVVTAWEVPERRRDVLSVQPLPIFGILGVANSSHPILTAWIVTMSAPQFPAEKAL